MLIPVLGMKRGSWEASDNSYKYFAMNYLKLSSINVSAVYCISVHGR